MSGRVAAFSSVAAMAIILMLTTTAVILLLLLLLLLLRRGFGNSHDSVPLLLLLSWYGLQPFGFGRELVVLGGEQVVHVADGLEEDVQAGLALDGPEDAAVLEPGVGEDAVQAAEDVDEVLDDGALVVAVGEDDEAAGEELRVGDDVGGPVERVAAVVDGAAALGLVVHGAQELPLGRAHLRAGGGRAGRHVKQEPHDQAVALRDQEPAELVEPERAVDAGRGRGELGGRRPVYRRRVGRRVVVVQSCEVFL